MLRSVLCAASLLLRTAASLRACLNLQLSTLAAFAVADVCCSTFPDVTVPPVISAMHAAFPSVVSPVLYKAGVDSGSEGPRTTQRNIQQASQQTNAKHLIKKLALQVSGGMPA